MTVLKIDGRTYRRMLIQGASRLNSKRKAVNDLNVFPIPDGDTGDNMYMTIESGCNAGSQDNSLSAVSSRISGGMLLGARGNSGVILSRIFAGVAKGLAGVETAELSDFSKAMASGVEESYKAVSTPVEGTILTVFREGVQAANASPAKTIDDWFEVLVPKMRESLEHTPELLPVLKEAGVVDSGGAGILCIVEGMKEVIDGQCKDYGSSVAVSAGKPQLNLDDFGPDTELKFGYCTEFLLRLQHNKISDIENFDVNIIKDYLNSVGESVVCFKDGSIVKAHVHTFNPGEILSHVQCWGEFLTLKVENMTLQHSETDIHDHFERESEPAEDDLFVARQKYGVVAVASGAGLVESFKETGVDVVIEGGQTMNPSSEDFIRAFDKIKAETILVFPNNSNIILAANQAASLYDKANVIVIPSKTIGSGYVACASIDKSLGSADEIVQAAIGIMDNVVNCQVSKAIRNTTQGTMQISEGDYIGFDRSRIISCAKTRNEAALKALDKFGIETHDVALVFKGQDTTATDADGLVAELQKTYPRTEIMLSDGGQPVFDYIIVLC